MTPAGWPIGTTAADADRVKAAWRPHPRCPDYAVKQLQVFMSSLPAMYYLTPCKGEVFGTLSEALHRLQVFAATQGFAVANISGSMQAEHPYFIVACLHHGKETRNWRGLEEHVERDEEGVVTSQRKQETTSVNAKGCKITWAISYKPVPRGSGSYHFVVGKCPTGEHTHNVAVNPLRYKMIEKMTTHYITAVSHARTHCDAFLSYNESLRILDRMGLRIDKDTYYNIK
jgi:hypothetical protein